MRVLMLIDKLSPGGTQRHLLRLVRELRTREVDVQVVCLSERGAWGEALAAEGVTVTALGCSSITPPNFCRAFDSVLRLIKQAQPDILHCLLFSANIIGPIAARWYQGTRPLSVIASRRDTGFWLRTRHALALRFVNRWVDHICCNSASVADSRRTREQWPSSRSTSIIPNAVDGEVFTAPAIDRASLGIDAAHWMVVSVARLRREKGQATIIRAAHSLRDSLPQLRVFLVGDGEEEDRLRQLSASLDIDDRILFTGHRDDVPMIFRAANCAVLVSGSEGQSNFLLEAMAARVPIIASDVPGNREVLCATVNNAGKAASIGGILVPARDPEALAAALLDLHNTPDRAATLTRSAGKIVEERYTPAAEADAYFALYESLADRTL